MPVNSHAPELTARVKVRTKVRDRNKFRIKVRVGFKVRVRVKVRVSVNDNNPGAGELTTKIVDYRLSLNDSKCIVRTQNSVARTTI